MEAGWNGSTETCRVVWEQVFFGNLKRHLFLVVWKQVFCQEQVFCQFEEKTHFFSQGSFLKGTSGPSIYSKTSQSGGSSRSYQFNKKLLPAQRSPFHWKVKGKDHLKSFTKVAKLLVVTAFFAGCCRSSGAHWAVLSILFFTFFELCKLESPASLTPCNCSCKGVGWTVSLLDFIPTVCIKFWSMLSKCYDDYGSMFHLFILWM